MMNTCSAPERDFFVLSHDGKMGAYLNSPNSDNSLTMPDILNQKENIDAESSQNSNSRLAFTVGLLGFEASDHEKLVRILQTQEPGERVYQVLNPIDPSLLDMVMVNYDNPRAIHEKDKLLALQSKLQVVAVSRGPLADAPVHHIRGMLIAARVLNVLDKVQVNKSKPSATLAEEDGNKIGFLPQKPFLSPTVAPVQSAATPTFTPAVASISESAGYRTLVVDDSLAIQKSLQIHLGSISQISVIDFACSGEEAIEKCATKQYDVIFLDIMMPGIDGYETCTLLRKKPEYKKTPIIMVSGKTSPLDEVKGVVAGCTTYLTKPVQPDAFQKLSIRVLAWLERQKKV